MNTTNTTKNMNVNMNQKTNITFAQEQKIIHLVETYHSPFEIADEINLDEEQVEDWISDKQDRLAPAIRTMMAIYNVIAVSINQILNDDGSMVCINEKRRQVLDGIMDALVQTDFPVQTKRLVRNLYLTYINQLSDMTEPGIWGDIEYLVDDNYPESIHELRQNLVEILDRSITDKLKKVKKDELVLFVEPFYFDCDKKYNRGFCINVDALEVMMTGVDPVKKIRKTIRKIVRRGLRKHGIANPKQQAEKLTSGFSYQQHQNGILITDSSDIISPELWPLLPVIFSEAGGQPRRSLGGWLFGK